MTRSMSDNSHMQSVPGSNIISYGKVHATTGSLFEPKLGSQTPRKKIQFNPAVRVILIPTVGEYRLVGLGDLMWWNDNDYKGFKQSALNELKLFMLKLSSMDSKAAIKALYQPDDRQTHVQPALHQPQQQQLSDQRHTTPLKSRGDKADNVDSATPTQAYMQGSVRTQQRRVTPQ